MDADKRQIARAASIVMVAFALSRALGLVRQMVIAGSFGTSMEMDAYQAAFRLPDLLFQLMAGGALGSAFIPTFSGYLAREDRAGAWRLTSAIVNLLLALLTLTALLAALVAPWLVERVIAPGFDAEKAALIVRLMRVMLISSVIFGVSGVIMGALNAQQHFVLPAVAPLLYNLSIIGGVLLLAPSWGVMGLAAGVVVGAALHLLVQVPGLVRFRARYTPVLTLRDPGVRQVARLMGPRVLGLAVVQLNFLVNTNLGSRLGEGAVSALNYAWLLMLLPQGVFAQAVATAAFPTFAEQVARGQRAAMRAALAATLRAVFALSLPAAVGLAVLRGPLVALLFERGDFDQTSTTMVAWALLFYALGLVAHAGLEIVARAFYALHDTKTPLLVGGGAMLLNVALSLTLPSLFESAGVLALGGLALANSLATTLELLGLLWLIRGRLNGLEGRRSLPALLRSAVAATLMGLALGALLWAWSDLNALLLGPAGVALGGLVYLVAAWALGVEEVRGVVSRVRRKTAL
ncbi:MAG: murein biosynthesis integral membrane protein MurJ [Anaerolineae bacterium]|jgi:putative peptidoglycan lipid II flippase